MIIDTLVLSGGGPSGIAYTGIYQALLDNKIIDKELTGIKEIITTSIGILLSFCMLIGIENKVLYNVIKGFDVSSMVKTDDICIDDLLVDYGIFPTTGIQRLFQSLIKNVLHKEDSSLRELYEFKGIKLTVKVFNTTKKQVELISYENHPELSIITLAQMTTAIPFFFKPVTYLDNLYVDGGLRGSFPIEHCESKNYLGIFINGLCTAHLFQDSVIGQLFPILDFMYSMLVDQDQIVYDVELGLADPRIICSEVNLGLNFIVSEDNKNEIIQQGYDETIKHIRTCDMGPSPT